MKHSYILVITFLFVVFPTYLNAEDLPNKPLHTFNIPITEDLDRSISIIIKHQNYSLTEFLKIKGIPFVEGASCNLNSKTNIVTLHLDHYSAALVVAIIGDITIYVLGGKKTEGELIKKYALPDIEEGCSF